MAAQPVPASRGRPPARPTPGPHAFDPDPEVPRDWYDRSYCRDCGKAGQPGDEQHPHGALPLSLAAARPTADEVRALEARILGERP